MSPDIPGSGRPTPRVQGADGRLLDPYHLLDAPRPPAASRLYPRWEQQELERARATRELRGQIFAAQAELDPADSSLEGEHLREVAAQQRDHAAAETRRLEWAAEALAADPSLADRMNPAVVHYARELLTEQTTGPGIGTDPAGAPANPQLTREDVARDEQLRQAAHQAEAADAAYAADPNGYTAGGRTRAPREAATADQDNAEDPDTAEDQDNAEDPDTATHEDMAAGLTRALLDEPAQAFNDERHERARWVLEAELGTGIWRAQPGEMTRDQYDRVAAWRATDTAVRFERAAAADAAEEARYAQETADRNRAGQNARTARADSPAPDAAHPAENRLWAEHDRDLAVAAGLEGPGIDDLGVEADVHEDDPAAAGW